MLYCSNILVLALPCVMCHVLEPSWLSSRLVSSPTSCLLPLASCKRFLPWNSNTNTKTKRYLFSYCASSICFMCTFCGRRWPAVWSPREQLGTWTVRRPWEISSRRIQRLSLPRFTPRRTTVSKSQVSPKGKAGGRNMEGTLDT